MRSAVPLPSFAHEQGLSEKERIARHEATLLPSEPGGASSSTQTPSAPTAVDDDDRVVLEPSSSSLQSPSTTDAVRPHTLAHDQSASQFRTAALTPPGLDVEGLHASSEALEKQELERRRLAEEASLPSVPDTIPQTAPVEVPEMSNDNPLGEDGYDGTGEERQNTASTTGAEPHRSLEAEALPQYNER